MRISTQPLSQTLLGTLPAALAAVAAVTPVAAQAPIAIDSRFAEVNGTRLHYLTAGKGDPVILLHGYAQTSHMWRPLIAELAKTHTVIAPDLRGFGESAKPPAATTRRRWRRTSTRSRHRSDTSASALPATISG